MSLDKRQVGLKVTIRELDDVLFKDVDGRIKASGKYVNRNNLLA